jgi:hypothetical protein
MKGVPLYLLSHCFNGNSSAEGYRVFIDMRGTRVGGVTAAASAEDLKGLELDGGLRTAPIKAVTCRGPRGGGRSLAVTSIEEPDRWLEGGAGEGSFTRLGARHQRAHRPMCPPRRWRADRRKLQYRFAAGRPSLPKCGTPPGATPLVSQGDLGGCGPIGMLIHTASAAKVTRSRTPERLDKCDAILEGLAQHFEHVAAALRPFIQQEDAVVRPRHCSRQGYPAAPISPTAAIVWCGRRCGRRRDGCGWFRGPRGGSWPAGWW